MNWGYYVPFLVTGIISLLNGLFIMFYLPETYKPNPLVIAVKKTFFPVFHALIRGHTALYLWVALLV